MNKKTDLLGILGGLGPMSTVYFYEMILSHTAAKKDQDHIDMLISSRASTPDRTAFILGKSDLSPLDVMIAEGQRLEAAGATLIAIPCNTAHYFYDSLTEALHTPVLNILEETVGYLHRADIHRIGVLATEGTVQTDSYGRLCRRHGMSCHYPSEADQKALSEIIYGQIKAGKSPDLATFSRIADSLFAEGCERIVLGCTELSLLKKAYPGDTRFVDSLEILACATIAACGKVPIGFDFDPYPILSPTGGACS